MISDNQSICPKCGGQLKYYDNVQRLIRTKFGNKKRVAIRRLRCCKCHAVHRELPDFIFPYKQYYPCPHMPSFEEQVTMAHKLRKEIEKDG